MINNDYYQDIIDKINQLIIKKKWEQALMLCKNELELPYIPIEYETIFQKLYYEINSYLRSDIKVVNHNWSLEEITNVLMSPFDEENHLVAFYYLQNHNVRLILPIIQKYLASKNINDENKTRLLLILQKQGVTQNFKVVKTNGNFNIIPNEIIPWNQLDFYQKIIMLLEDKVHIDNPGIYKICLFLLESYLEKTFPLVPETQEVAALAAVLYINACALHSINVTILEGSNKFQTSSELVNKYMSFI